MPVERHRRCTEQEDTIARLQAELAAAQQELAAARARVLALVRTVAAQQEAAVQIRQDGAAEGYQQGVDDARRGRHRRPPGGRWLRAVPAVALLAARPARHKLLAGAAASAALVAVAAPQMNLAPWISGAPAPRAPSAAAAYTPPARGGGGVPVPPPRTSPPGRSRSSPPGKPGPAPGRSRTSPPGKPSPAPADTAAPSPDASTAPAPDATATACPAPPGHA